MLNTKSMLTEENGIKYVKVTASSDDASSIDVPTTTIDWTLSKPSKEENGIKFIEWNTNGIFDWQQFTHSTWPLDKKEVSKKIAYHTLEEAIEILEDEGVITEDLKINLLNNLSVLKP